MKLPLAIQVCLSLHVYHQSQQCFSHVWPEQQLPSNMTWPKGYKTFFMLSSAQTKVYPAHKC